MNFANKISTFRILSVPFFVACLVYYSPEKDFLRFIALGIFTVAMISDAVDGYIARKSKQQSPAGLILDPLGDKLLLMSAYICLYFIPLAIKLPLFVMLIVLTRDIIILIGSLVIFMVRQKVNIIPSKWGKFTTFFQMSAVIVVLLQSNISFLFWWLAAVFTVISGVDYIMRGFKVLYAVDNSRNSH